MYPPTITASPQRIPPPLPQHQSFNAASLLIDRLILHKRTPTVGASRGGDMTAIMGASGAGKTTLLECISLRSREFKGAVHLNGRPARAGYFTQSGTCGRAAACLNLLATGGHCAAD